MKICMTSLYYERGYGQGLCVKKIALELARRGNEVHLLYGGKKAEQETKNPNLFLHYVEHINFPALDLVTFGLALSKEIKKLDSIIGFDIIYPQSYEFGFVDFKKLKKPFVFHARGTVEGNAINRPKISFTMDFLRKIVVPHFMMLDEKCCKNAKAVIADSEITKKEIEDYYRIEGKKIFVVPEGIDLEAFNPETVSGEEIKKRFNLKDSKVLLFAGRLVPQKGAQFIIEAMHSITKKIPNAKLLIVGEDTIQPYSKMLGRLIQKHGLQERIIFAGYVEQEKMPEFFSAADFVVSPSTYEPFGIVNLEALAMKKPLITTSSAGSAEILRDAAVIIEPNSPQQIAEAVIKINSSNALKKKLAENASKKIRNFEWKELAKKIEILLEGAIK